MESVVVTLDALTRLEQLRAEWLALEACSDASFFISWAWMGTWLASLPSTKSFRILRVRRAGQLIGLGVLGRHVGRHMGPVSARGLFLNATGDAAFDSLTIEYNDLLARRGEAELVRRAVIEQLPRLSRRWDELHLPGVEPSAHWSRHVRAGYAQHARRSPTYQVDLTRVRARDGDYLGLLSANTRAQIRRSIKEYEKLGALVLEQPQSLDAALACFEALIALHQAAWADRGEPGSFAAPYIRDFHAQLIRTQFAAGGVQLLHLRAGEHTVGYLYNFVWRGRVYNYQSGLDYALGGKHARPGLVCHALAIEMNARNGQQVYDMMAGEHRYKESLATDGGSMEWRVIRRARLKFRIEDTLRAWKARMNNRTTGEWVPQWVDSEAGFDALAHQWQSLEAAATLPTAHYAFNRTAARFFAALGSLRVLTLRRGADLAAVAPLCRSGGLVPRLQFIGAAEIGEPCDMLCADDEAAAALADALVRTRTPLALERMPANAAFVAALQRAMQGRGLCKIRPTNPAPTLALDAQWINPETQFNSGRRSDFRRAQRHAEKFGAVTCEVLTPTAEQLDGLLDEAIAVEMQSWKGRDGTALGVDPVRGPFFRAYAHAACARGILRMAFLRIDGKAIGMQIALECEQRFWLFKIGYDEAYARCSPGTLLMLQTLKYAAERGLRAYEMLGSAEPWTAAWTQAQHECVMINTYPHGLPGWLAFAADASAWAWAKARRINVLGRVRQMRRAAVDWVMQRCARAYIAGPALSDARAACLRLRDAGCANTVGYFNGDDEAPRVIADADLAAIEMFGAEGLDAYLSVKVPALKFDAGLLAEIARAAGAKNVGMHFDSHAPEDADRTFTAVDAAVAAKVAVGCTLPARWRRSVDDAARVKDRALRVRIVKGQWVDPTWPDADLNAGYLAVVDALAGRQAVVAVATHDPVLARTALQRLQAAGTPCELELLYGLPTRAALGVARELGVKARVYVPFGTAWLPYALGQARRKPRMVFWVLRDALQGLFGRP